VYKYKGINEHGKATRGRLDATNEVDLQQRLESMGLDLISCKELNGSSTAIRGKKITRQDLINFCFHMEQMTRVGVPIIEALVDLRDSLENLRFREIISAMVAAIEGGKTFSEALAEFPRVFDDVFVNLVRVGEHSGELNKVLFNITETLKWQDELAAQTKKVLIYPAFVGSVVMGVIFFLMLYLVPQMVNFIESMGHELPLHTQLLIIVSDFFIHYWHLVLIVPIAIFAVVKYLARVRPGVAYQIDALKLRMWLIGPILRKIILSRFANYFSLLYASGVTVLQGMQISEDIVGNRVIAKALREARQQIEDGKNMSDSFDSAGLFPPLVLRMIKIGENTGGLDTALTNVSYFYNRDVKDAIEKLQSMIEPMMTVVLGLILGWVMLSVLGPIYDIISKIKM